MVAAAGPVFFTVTVCALLVVLSAWLGNVSELGVTDRAGPEVPPPEPGKTSNSDTCAADQPVFPVKLSCTYWALAPDGRLIVTVFPVDGLNVYPAEGTIVL